jgi:hypothetical protein
MINRKKQIFIDSIQVQDYKNMKLEPDCKTPPVIIINKQIEDF